MSRQFALLAAEHIAALEMLEKLEHSLRRIEESSGDIWEFVRFMEHKLAGHLPQEEEILYPKLSQANPSLQRQVDIMVQEHQAIRQAHRDFREELEQQADYPAIAALGERLLALLKEHIQRENDALANLHKG